MDRDGFWPLVFDVWPWTQNGPEEPKAKDQSPKAKTWG